MFSIRLYRKIDNAQIIVFRICFGILVMAECWGALLTGWVKKTFVDPSFTFTFFGFEWTHFLLGKPMYVIFFVLGFLGLFIALGLFYRSSSLLFALGWSLVYFMQKTHYNNHYYLLVLVAWFMVCIPAYRYASLDVKRRPELQTIYTYNWTRLLFITQLLLVYTYAAIAKIYPGWYEGVYLHLRFQHAADWFKNALGWPGFASLLNEPSFALALSWLGLAFDFLIIPALLWKPTQKYAFIAAFIFHGFNSLTLHIGIFPYFALAMSLFCLPPETVRRLFLPKKPALQSASAIGKVNSQQRGFACLLYLYLLWQIYLPLRHWFIPGDVLWTEEGHRLSWRMMLRSKSGILSFFITDLETSKKERVFLDQYLTKEQRQQMTTSPDMIWQFAQYLKTEFSKQGRNIGVYVRSRVSVNGGPYHDFIDPTVDLTTVDWRYFSHQPWILTMPSERPIARHTF